MYRKTDSRKESETMLEKDINDIELMDSPDNAMLLKEIKELKSMLADSKMAKTDAERKAEIMAIKDTHKRLEAIKNNMELFR